MKVSIKLNARFARYLPAHAVAEEAAIEVEQSSTVEAVLLQLNMPLEKCRLVLVNGEYLAPGERATHQLTEGDHIAVWPPLVGG